MCSRHSLSSGRGGWTSTLTVCEEGSGDSRAPTCDAARGPGVSRLRALTLSAVGENDLPQFITLGNRLATSRSQIPRFLVIVNNHVC
jgi:hypothetical protein